MSDTTSGTQIVSWLSLALAVGGIVIGAVNHKRIRSSCCGVEKTISLDIDNTTPKGEKTEAIDVPRRSERLKEKEEQKDSKPSSDENAS
jgi:hypothetical protein